MKKRKNIMDKYILLTSVLSLLLFPIISSLSQPLTITPQSFDITGPLPPSTGTIGECTPWETRDNTCIGDVHHYTQCVKTASGGIWQEQSEICSSYGDNSQCLVNKCVKKEEIIRSVVISISVLLVAIGLFIYLRRKR